MAIQRNTAYNLKQLKGLRVNRVVLRSCDFLPCRTTSHKDFDDLVDLTDHLLVFAVLEFLAEVEACCLGASSEFRATKTQQGNLADKVFWEWYKSRLYNRARVARPGRKSLKSPGLEQAGKPTGSYGEALNSKCQGRDACITHTSSLRAETWTGQQWTQETEQRKQPGKDKADDMGTAKSRCKGLAKVQTGTPGKIHTVGEGTKRDHSEKDKQSPQTVPSAIQPQTAPSLPT